MALNHCRLRLFKCFNPFRILICSGDGSVGWVLSEIDKLHMTVSDRFCNRFKLKSLVIMTANGACFCFGAAVLLDPSKSADRVTE
jgi:hypothetical protein